MANNVEEVLKMDKPHSKATLSNNCLPFACKKE